MHSDNALAPAPVPARDHEHRRRPNHELVQSILSAAAEIDKRISRGKDFFHGLGVDLEQPTVEPAAGAAGRNEGSNPPWAGSGGAPGTLAAGPEWYQRRSLHSGSRSPGLPVSKRNPAEDARDSVAIGRGGGGDGGGVQELLRAELVELQHQLAAEQEHSERLSRAQKREIAELQGQLALEQEVRAAAVEQYEGLRMQFDRFEKEKEEGREEGEGEEEEEEEEEGSRRNEITALREQLEATKMVAVQQAKEAHIQRRA
jgi:hypothetical protein